MPSLQYNNLFITGPMNYSHDEKVVDYALYCGIAKTIGVATAGRNGLVNRIPLHLILSNKAVIMALIINGIIMNGIMN